jgi:hypothetical protein
VIGEPRDGALEHADGGDRLFIGADLGVGHAGVIVDDGVQEGYSDLGPGSRAAFTGAVGRLAGIVSALLSTQKLVSATVRDVAEFGDVDVDQRAGIVMLVAAQRFTGDAVDVR